MVKAGEDFLVYDAKTGDDITRSVLTQIIFEQENKDGQNLLPIVLPAPAHPLLRRLDAGLVPRYLELSIDTLSKEQDKLRQQMSTTLGINPLTAPFEQHIRRNMDMFEKAFAMFSPFAKRDESETGGDVAPAASGAVPPSAPAAAPAAGDLDELKNQLAAMQKKIDSLSRK